MRTITHTTTGPVQFTLTVDAAVVEVIAEDRDTTTVTLEPLTSGDQDAARLIEDTSHTSDGDRFTVRVPRRKASTGVPVGVTRRGSVVSVVGNYGVVTGSVTGVTIVNGQVIAGAGAVVSDTAGEGLRITVRVPAGSSAALSGPSVDLRTRGRLDRVAADTHSGDLRVAHARDAELVTKSGDVHIGRAATVRARSMAGDIEVTELAGNAALTSMSGDITVHAVTDCAVTAHTMSGDVDLSAPRGIEIDADTRTMSGRTRNHRR